MRRLVSVLLAAFAASAAGAQGWIVPRPCAPPPPPPPECRDSRCVQIMPLQCPQINPIVRTSSEVRAEIVGRVVRYEVSESFLNRGDRVGEADYVFPLPKGAAFEDLKLSINGELVSGETMAADRARQVYEDIVRRMRDPALVEWMGSGMLRTRIFPIAPGEEKRVVVRFQSLLEREGSALRVDYVRGTPPKSQLIGPPRMIVDAAVHRTRDTGESPNVFTLTYDNNSDYGTPYSPTHSLRTLDRQGRRVVTATGEGREIMILLPLRRPNATSVTVLTHRPDDADGFALIAITPPATPSRTTPRDVVFVVDVSGSMRGEKLTQAKAAGRSVLESLGPNDRFRIVDFATDVRSFRDGWSAATRENVRAAKGYIDDLRADGSTNISGALSEALSFRNDEERLPLVVFVTDGEPTVGERNPDAIAAMAARLRGDARVFAFGVSADVNATLIEQLALEGHGTAHFVRQGESVERAVSLLATRLTSPILTDLRVRAEGVTLRQLQPSGTIDLYAGQDLIVLARYDGSGPVRILLEGRGATGRVSWSQNVAFPDRERGNPFVGRLWAAQRLGWLAAEKRKNGATTELDGEIKSLGERFGIPTEFSSYLVVEPGMQVANRTDDMRTRGQAMPAAPFRAAAGARQLEQVVVTGASAAADMSKERFELARDAAAKRETKSVAVLDSLSAATESRLGNVRRAGERVFTLVGGVWTDARYTQAMTLVKVKAYSAAYFELVSRLPGISEVLGLGDRIIVAGRNIAISIAPDGAEEVKDVAITDIVKRW